MACPLQLLIRSSLWIIIVFIAKLLKAVRFAFLNSHFEFFTFCLKKRPLKLYCLIHIYFFGNVVSHYDNSVLVPQFCLYTCLRVDALLLLTIAASQALLIYSTNLLVSTDLLVYLRHSKQLYSRPAFAQICPHPWFHLSTLSSGLSFYVRFSTVLVLRY